MGVVFGLVGGLLVGGWVCWFAIWLVWLFVCLFGVGIVFELDFLLVGFVVAMIGIFGCLLR